MTMISKELKEAGRENLAILRAQDAERMREYNLKTWVLMTPYGPMAHAQTGESYQAFGARLVHEHRQKQKV